MTDQEGAGFDFLADGPNHEVHPEPVSLPIIDLACLQLQQHSAPRSRVIEDIAKACQQLGCFLVVNHGIHESVMGGALQVASDFFKSPMDGKTELASNDITKPVRYRMNGEDGMRLTLKHYANPLDHWIQFWPLHPPDYRERMGKCAAEVRRVALQVLGAIFESLGLCQAYQSDKLNEGMQVMAVNCYPPHPQPEIMLGLAPHSDYGYITILLQSCPGLQIMDTNGKEWRAVPYHTGTIHVHVGDHLEVLSNGRYKSVMHRATLNPEKMRISIASIHSLSMDEKVGCPEELVHEKHPRGYKESSFRDFLDYLSTTNITKGERFIDTLRITGP